MSTTGALTDALAGALSFGAAHVGAAVIDAQGLLASAGETEYVFELASVTKLFSATCALIAIEEGTIALADPVGPEGSTVAHLLSHASGLSMDSSEIVLAPPGTRRIYSNAGFELLARHLEEQAGMSFPQYLSSALFEPLAMAQTSLLGSAASGARSSIADLARFASELIAPSLISSETLGLATRVAFPGLVGVLPGFGRFDPCDWGLGFELKDHKVPHWMGALNSAFAFGHFGQAGSFLWVDPSVGLALVFASDRPFGTWAAKVWPEFADAVLEARRFG